MKNRRADIPITILVLGVVAICGLAILSFIVNESLIGNMKELGGDALGLEVFERLHSALEKNAFYEKAGASPEEIVMKDYQKGVIKIESYNPLK